MSMANRIFLFLVTTLSCMGLDQATKLLAEAVLKEKPRQVFWNNLFHLEYAENRGAFLSLGATLADHHRWFLLTVVASAVLIALAVYLCVHKPLRTGEIVGYSLILAGGASNMLDRIASGFVIDFMNMGVLGLRTGIFNVADVVILTGLVLVVIAHYKNLREAPAASQIPAQ